MDIQFIVSLVVGVVSVVLATVAIWYSTQSERRSNENYNRTKELLAEIDKKAAVIESTMNNTQDKLVDTVTAIARPKEATQEELLMSYLLPSIMENPALLDRIIALGSQQNGHGN